MSLDFIYYPVSAIMWFWHEVFGYLLGMESGIAWALSVVFLVWSIRVLLLKPFITQVRSMRKMQEFAPEMQKLKKKYGDDKQKLQSEMQKLQSEHGVNPLGGCLPLLVQIPVFIGIYHVLRSFDRTDTTTLTKAENAQIANYVFSPEEVRQFLDAELFGLVGLSERIVDFDGLGSLLSGAVDVMWQAAILVVPLTILAGVLTHITARHSVSRQGPAQAANPQSAMMNKVMLYLFPLGVVVIGPFFPLGIVFYWLSNNTWTLAQQRVIYKKIDAEEEAKKEAARAERQRLGPRPGQKPQAGQKPQGGQNPQGSQKAGPRGADVAADDGSGPETDASGPEADGTDAAAPAKSGGSSGRAKKKGTDGGGKSASNGGRTRGASGSKGERGEASSGQPRERQGGGRGTTNGRSPSKGSTGSPEPRKGSTGSGRGPGNSKTSKSSKSGTRTSQGPKNNRRKRQ